MSGKWQIGGLKGEGVTTHLLPEMRCGNCRGNILTLICLQAHISVGENGGSFQLQGVIGTIMGPKP